MQWISSSGIFYIVHDFVLPIGGTIIGLSFLLFLIKMMKDDQLGLFFNGKMMSPSDAKAYIKQQRKEKMEKEFDTILKYGMLQENQKSEFMELREDGKSIKAIINKLTPKDE